jgi:hypothetical protein
MEDNTMSNGMIKLDASNYSLWKPIEEYLGPLSGFLVV